MNNPTQTVRPTQPVKYSFPRPFPRVRFKNCVFACYRPTLSQGFPVRILRMVSNWAAFVCTRSNACICPFLHGSQHAAPYSRMGHAIDFGLNFLYSYFLFWEHAIQCLLSFLRHWSTTAYGFVRLFPSIYKCLFPSCYKCSLKYLQLPCVFWRIVNRHVISDVSVCVTDITWLASLAK